MPFSSVLLKRTKPFILKINILFKNIFSQPPNPPFLRRASNHSPTSRQSLAEGLIADGLFARQQGFGMAHKAFAPSG